MKLMTKELIKKVVTIEKDASILQARTQMEAHHIRHLPVVDKSKRLIGMVSDRDIRSAMPYQLNKSVELEKEIQKTSRITVEDVMTHNPHSISTQYTLQDVLVLFQKIKVGAFPIVDEDQKVVGIISDRDMLNAFIQTIGAGDAGSFLGVEVPVDNLAIRQVVNTLLGEEISIASMVVIREWRAGHNAIFAYVLTQNIAHVRQLMQGLGFELIDPMQWFLHQFQAQLGI